MRTTSLFAQIIDKYFQAGTIKKITEKINGEEKEQPLLHKTMLTEEYSNDLTWTSADYDESVVAADLVTMDSSLPLKSRDTFGKAVGEIPKLGIKYQLREKDLKELQILQRVGGKEAEIAAKLLKLPTRCIKGMDIRKEIMFLEGLSTGQMAVAHPDKEGVAIRVDFGYKAEHFYKATTAAWSSVANASPVDDIRQMFDAAEAEGKTIGHVILTKKYFDYLRNSVQGKKLAANFMGQVVTANTQLVVPTRQRMLDALEDEFGATFEYISPKFQVEKVDGTKQTVTPFAEANVVGIPAKNMGRLVYSDLVEEANPVAGVSYSKSGSHVLISQYSINEPSLAEFTSGQAFVLPVIDNGANVFVLQADQTNA